MAAEKSDETREGGEDVEAAKTQPVTEGVDRDAPARPERRGKPETAPDPLVGHKQGDMADRPERPQPSALQKALILLLTTLAALILLYAIVA